MTRPQDTTSEVVARVRAACVGHPYAKIEWPHRLLHEAADHIEALTKRVGELEGALEKAARHFDAIRGAVESNQVVDKDVHGTAIAARDAARRLTGGEG